MLCSNKVFHDKEAEVMLLFIERIGIVNLTYIKSISLFVTCPTKVEPWLRLLQTLANGVTGLRSLTVEWDTKEHEYWCERTGPGWPPPPSSRYRGLGDDLGFARALAQIQGLEQLVIKGYYGKRWPAYLQREMNVLLYKQDLILKEPESWRA
jgi:hypothetical protein